MLPRVSASPFLSPMALRTDTSDADMCVRLSRSVSDGFTDRESLVEVFHRLLRLIRVQVDTSDVVKRVGLKPFVTDLAMDGERLVVVFQRLPRLSYVRI